MQIDPSPRPPPRAAWSGPGSTSSPSAPPTWTLDIRRYPNHALKTVEDCVAYVANDLQGTGVRACMRVAAGDDTSHFEDMGVTMFLENQIP